jgi:nucleotide-binding universal stress UspA family protein
MGEVRMMKIQSILVPTDFSETANHALSQAIELALHARASLDLFHVAEPSEPATGVVSAVKDYLERLEDASEHPLALKLSILRGNELDVRYASVSGVTPLEGIAAKVEELAPDLLVMGTHGRTGLNRLLMGSVAEKVLRHVPVNVLTVSGKSPVVRSTHAFERVLVAVDFSDFSRRALRAASAILEPGATLTVAHVVASPMHPSFYAGGVTRLFQLDPDMPDRIRENVQSWLEGVEAEIVVREGDIFAELMDVSVEADSQVIVMGTRGLAGLDHLLLGSVTEKVVRRATVPVLTVH